MSSKECVSEIQIDNLIHSEQLKLSYLPKRIKYGDPRSSEKWLIYTKVRRLRLQKARLKGWHTHKDELMLINKCGGICEICGKINSCSIDHIIPISKGGSDGIENLRVVCNSCNSKKGNRNG